MRRIISSLAVLAWLALIGAPAAAHLTPNSEITLALHADGARADIIVPQGEYGYATGNPTGNDPEALARARAYLARHFAVFAPDGRRWTVTLRNIAFEQIAGPPDLHATAMLVPPRGASPRQFRIAWSALLAELPSHFALFVLARDHEGMVGDGRAILGAVRASDTTLDVDRAAPRAGVALANAMLLGIDHIVGGYDHLLFLLALLLPAPLVARDGRWRDVRSLGGTALQLLRIVTAFTIGHSLTLVAATLGGWSLPTAPVEIAIAASVLLSAAHAIRPLFPGREHVVALGFGLVHGLAFATLLHDAGAAAASTATSLLGFNLGIEVVQLAIVALVTPPLLVLARGRRFAALRTVLAGATAVAAGLWIANRAFGVGDGMVAMTERALSHGLWIVGGLYGLAALQLWAERRRFPRSRTARPA